MTAQLVREWTAALDDFEATLTVCEATLEQEADAPVPTPFSTPACSGPIPGDLTPRAEDLLRRSRDLQRRLVLEQQRIRSEIQRLPRVPGAVAQSGETVDFGA
jgi:hypothetical protein